MGNSKTKPVRAGSSSIICLYTEKEIKILKKQWAAMMLHVDKNGKDLFTTLFSLDEKLLAKFSFAIANDFDVKKSINDSRLVCHVRRIFDVIDEIIQSLGTDQQESAAKRIVKIGAVHKRIGLKKENFEVFKRAVSERLQIICKSSFDEAAKRSWSKLLDEIISIMTSKEAADHVLKYSRNENGKIIRLHVRRP